MDSTLSVGQELDGTLRFTFGSAVAVGKARVDPEKLTCADSLRVHGLLVGDPTPQITARLMAGLLSAKKAGLAYSFPRLAYATVAQFLIDQSQFLPCVNCRSRWLANRTLPGWSVTFVPAGPTPPKCGCILGK
jgi:hypothetical protein